MHTPPKCYNDLKVHNEVQEVTRIVGSNLAMQEAQTAFEGEMMAGEAEDSTGGYLDSIVTDEDVATNAKELLVQDEMLEEMLLPGRSESERGGKENG